MDQDRPRSCARTSARASRPPRGPLTCRRSGVRTWPACQGFAWWRWRSKPTIPRPWPPSGRPRSAPTSSAVRRPTHGTPYVEVALLGETVLLFQAVASPTEGKNRMHLDLATPAGSDQQDELGRLVALGAAVLDVAPDHPWVVMADPEGNEFCVLPAE